MKTKLIPFNRDLPFTSTHGEIHRFYQSLIANAIQELLEKKHLYQAVTMDDASIFSELKAADVEEDCHFFSTTEHFGNLSQMLNAVALKQPIDEQSMVNKKKDEVRKAFVEFANRIGRGTWHLESSIPGFQPLMKSITHPSIEQLATYAIPTVRIPCSQCNGTRPPHNSGYRGLKADIPPHNLYEGNPPIQIFTLPYECQNCSSGEPLIFLVRREGMKLTLVGRSQFEKPDVPDCVPKNVISFYRNAIIARGCNQVLCGLFQLRTLIEQHMRNSLQNPPSKLTGDELADLYAQTLPENFAGNFPSLRKVYQDLSMALHAASEDEKLFDDQVSAIEGHFAAVRIFRQYSVKK